MSAAREPDDELAAARARYTAARASDEARRKEIQADYKKDLKKGNDPEWAARFRDAKLRLADEKLGKAKQEFLTTGNVEQLLSTAENVVGGEVHDAGKGQAAHDDLVGGQPYLKAAYVAAGKLHAARKMTVEGIQTRSGLSTRRAYRIYRQLKQGAVVYQDGTVRAGSGYRFDPDELNNDPPRYRLIRA